MGNCLSHTFLLPPKHLSTTSRPHPSLYRNPAQSALRGDAASGVDGDGADVNADGDGIVASALAQRILSISVCHHRQVGALR